jgi:hypothetical protein
MVLSPAIGPVGGELSQLFFTWMSSPIESNGRRILESHAAKEARTAQLAGLQQAVMNDFAESVEELERTFPNNQLNPAWARI